MQALRQAGCGAIDDYPKSPPDLNAIELAWNLIRQRLEDTEPDDFEGRPAFVARLRAGGWAGCRGRHGWLGRLSAHWLARGGPQARSGLSQRQRVAAAATGGGCDIFSTPSVAWGN